MLTVTTTHLKPGLYPPQRARAQRESDAARALHPERQRADMDLDRQRSGYLTEPYIKSRNFSYDPGYQMALYPCSVDIEVRTPGGRNPALPAGHQPVPRRVRDEVGAAA